ncbi:MULTISPECIES: AEC family transporter [unclassified Variovorax]|uniref:AEC family transporter n=1 Tax=unclassified Variovorax TaxID=663243 RepID=UPI002575A8F0|nr:MULTISPECIES: AEC family transporter [unclassified Variovorax]MDM0091159.1 AEC family transporter [Variovorax sp. J22G40]MDM0148839.1 AEC family transporter [Variovorax sp. J2P1-31]
MLPIFLVTFPFFALIAAGYAAARLRVLPLEAIPGLNVFVLYFALPCMLYRFGAGTPIAQLLDGSVAMVWGLCALAVVAVMVWRTRSARIGWNDASFGALVAAFPNTGFMGVPLLAALLGPGVAGPVIITITFDMVVTSSLCIALSRLDGADEHGAAKAVRQALRGMFMNPLPWSILLGALASALQVQLFGPIDRTVTMLADAASPAALFTIGAVLARSALVARRQPALGLARVGDVLPVVLAKLLLHPLLVWAAARGAIAWGLPLSQPALVAIVLVAALPSASNVSMLAERFGADNGRIARIILWTTVAAFFTFPLAVGWLN